MKSFPDCAPDFCSCALCDRTRPWKSLKQTVHVPVLLLFKNSAVPHIWRGFLSFLTSIRISKGWPRGMLADNGTNFMAHHKEIQQLLKQIDRHKIQMVSSHKGLIRQWLIFARRFERMLRSENRAVNAIMRNLDLATSARFLQV